MATSTIDPPAKPARFAPLKRNPLKEKMPKRDYKSIVDAWEIHTDIIERLKLITSFTCFVIEVTPEMAMDLLTLNDMGHNRHIESSLVDDYTFQMSKGDWMPETGEALKVTDELKLIDGQKRLWAIFLSGVTIKMLIIAGMNKKVFPYLDLQQPRNAADITSINGMQANAGQVAQVVKSIILYKKKSIAKGTTTAKDVKNFEVNEFEMKTPVMNRIINDLDLAKATWCVWSNNFFTPPQWVFAFYTLRTLPGKEDEARTFMDRFADGVELRATSPIKVVRNMFENEFKHLPGGKKKGRTNKASISTKYKFLFEAWNLYIDRASVSTITVDLDSPIIPKPRWK